MAGSGTAVTGVTGVTAGRYVGARVQRLEDPRLLAGRGNYIDDHTVPGMLHAAFVRSPVARGSLSSVDVSAALAMPGVAAVFTMDDLRDIYRPTFSTIIGRDAITPPLRPLADGVPVPGRGRSRGG
jgi:carbon-monoxide dehydrogenase large subunit